MPTPYQGASGPSGAAGLQLAPRQPVSRNCAACGPALMQLEQISQEQLILSQVKKLTVGLLIDMVDLRANELSGQTSTPLKTSWNCTRHDPVLPMECPSDRSVEVVCAKGKGKGSSGVSDLNYPRIQYLILESNSPGESPPPPPRTLFGRDELVEEIVGLVDSLIPIALIGPGGIGKTSIALTILHHNRIRERFGDNRRFIRCDQFQATRTHFLCRLSTVIGAGTENPKDLASLRPFLSSKEMLIVLDNAESVLDPQGIDADDIYAVMEELSQFDNICLCVTSRISTIPPDCETLDVPILSMEAARNAFYSIYKNDERSDRVDNILERLDFHPLSITLLATAARHNKWDTGRLTREWERQRTAVLHTHYNKSFAATIELSLTSPMFQGLGPDARDLLGVVAFFPQGVDENNLEWLFSTTPSREDAFDKFCILSLTYRANGFVTMLAPLRDHFCPKDPKSSPFLRAIKGHYFSRLSVDRNPDKPSFEETRWIMSEDVNVEHLLDVFTSIETSSSDVWDACANYTQHLRHHKPRLIGLGPKIEGLPDDHPSKPQCMFQLSQLFHSVGQYAEGKRLLVHALRLWREWGNDLEVARTLRTLGHTNQHLNLHKEGILQVTEALEIYKQLDHTVGQADSLQCLAFLFAKDNQLDAASRAIKLSSDESLAYEHHHILSHIYNSRGEAEASICHHETALRIASSLNSDQQVPILRCLARLLLEEERFDDVQVHLEHLKSHTANNPFGLGQAMLLQAYAWFRQNRFEEAKAEVLCAISLCERIGVSENLLVEWKNLLRDIGKTVNDRVTSGEWDNDGEFPGMAIPRVR